MLRVKNGPCAPLRLSSMLIVAGNRDDLHRSDGGRAALGA